MQDTVTIKQHHINSFDSTAGLFCLLLHAAQPCYSINTDAQVIYEPFNLKQNLSFTIDNMFYKQMQNAISSQLIS